MSSGSMNAINTLALFNITLNLEFNLAEGSYSVINDTGNENTNNILKTNLTWNEIKTFVHPDINPHWIGSVKTWYIPLMSREAAGQLRNFFIGENKSIAQLNDKDLVGFCGKEIFEEPIAILKGFGDTQIIKCYFDKDILGAWSTTYWSDKLDRLQKAITFITLTDNANFVLEVRVWEDQDQAQRIDWIAYSKGKNISKEIMDQIVNHIERIGFDPLNVLTVKYENCNRDSEIKRFV